MVPVSIKGVLFSPHGEIVLLQNERDEWELPGGRIEVGESSKECLAREIREELNLEVAVGVLLDTWLFEVIPGRQVSIATNSCIVTGPFNPVLSHEHRKIGLFASAALPADLPRGYRNCFETALRSV